MNIITAKSDLFHQNNLLSTTIELITAILDYTIFYDMLNPIPTMFEELTSLENRVKVVFEVSISTPLMKPVHILSKLLIFATLRISLQTADAISEEVFDQFCARLCYTSSMLLSKKYILDLVISKKLGIIYWNRLKKLKYIETPKWFKFENQCIALMVGKSVNYFFYKLKIFHYKYTLPKKFLSKSFEKCDLKRFKKFCSDFIEN